MGKKSQKQPTTVTKPARLGVLKRVELNQLIDQLLVLGYNTTTSLTEQWEEYEKIQAILERVKLLELDLKDKSSGSGGGGRTKRTQHLAKFLNWARENGAKFDNIEIAEFPNYELGIVAKSNLSAGETFISVPRKMIISTENSNESIAPIMSELPMIKLMSNVKMAFSLLVEKLNPTSFWRPYLDILPERYSTVMSLNVTDMKELKGSSALPDALNQCKSIARQYAFINKFIQQAQEKDIDPKIMFTYDLYCWAVSTVMTRQNAIPRTTIPSTTSPAVGEVTEISTESETVETISKNLNELTVTETNDQVNGGSSGGGGGDASINDSTIDQNHQQQDKDKEDLNIPALIPLWDLANHMNGHLTSSYNMETHSVEGSTMKNFTKGEQVFIHYGSRNNSEFFVHNGFVYPEHPNDSVPIRLGLSISDLLLQERTSLLKLLGIPKNCKLNVLPAPIYISPELLGFARVFNMNEESLTHWLSNGRSKNLLNLDCSLDTAIEAKAWIFLKMRLTILLRSFVTSLKDDEHMIDNHKKGQNLLSHNRAMVIQFRITEKRILTDALEYVEQRTKP